MVRAKALLVTLRPLKRRAAQSRSGAGRPFAVRVFETGARFPWRTKKGDPFGIALCQPDSLCKARRFFGLLLLQKLFFKQRVGVFNGRFGVHSGGRHGTLVTQFAEQMLQRMIKLHGGAIDSLIQRIGFMGNGHRLMTFGAGLHLTLDVVGAGLVAGLIVNVHFHPSQVFIVVFERAFNGCTNPFFQSDAAFDVIIAIDLDLHS
jgi:hypothetical protein